MFNPLELFVGSRYVRAKRDNHFISFVSVAAIAGITIGVAALIVVLSVMNGFEKEFRERVLDVAAHATVQPFTGGQSDWQALRDAALQHPKVTGAAPYIDVQGMLATATGIAGVAVRGIEPAAEPDVSGLTGLMRAGALEDLVPGEFRIVLGSALAERLGVGLGDSVVLMTTEGTVTPAGIVPRMRRFEVAGLFHADMHEYDNGLAYLNIVDVRRLYRIPEHLAAIRLRLDDLFAAPEVSHEIAEALGGGYYVSNWTRQYRNFFRSIQLTKTVMFVMLMLIVAVAAFNIISTLVMVVTDKRGDIAILRTTGAKPSSILGVFVVQGAFIGVIGTTIGLVLGVVLAANAETFVRWLERLLGTEFVASDVYYLSSLPSEIHVTDLVVICATVIALALLSTLYPAWQASKTQPAEALRYE